jgi:GNAT superfamily N-acetyltransferase
MMLEISWCDDDRKAGDIVEFFVRNITREYISHGEIQSGRAISTRMWSPDLSRVMSGEISSALRRESNDAVAVGYAGNGLAAMAIVGYDDLLSYGVLHDLVVEKTMRDSGYGGQMLDWITLRSRDRGISRLFLESGIENEAAHRFFARYGFSPISKTMMLDLK